MQSYRRSSFALTVPILIVLVGVVTALACASDPVPHDLPHPAWCVDTRAPAALKADHPLLLAKGATSRPRLGSPLWVVPAATLSGDLAVDLWVVPHPYSSMQENPSSRFPRSLLTVRQL